MSDQDQLRQLTQSEIASLRQDAISTSANMRADLKDRPELKALLERTAKLPPMTSEQIEARRQSWIRGMTARCEHGELDFEQCPKCRGWE